MTNAVDLEPNEPSSHPELTGLQAIAGRLALEIMHGIRNPLETVGHLCYLAEQEADCPAQVRVYMRQADEQLRNLSRIANQTLSYAKLQDKKPTDLVELAEAALSLHQKTIEAKRICLVRRLPADLIVSVQGSRIL